MILCVLFWIWDIWRVDPELSLLCCCSYFHTVGQSHQKWQQCLVFRNSVPMFPWIASAVMNVWPFSSHFIAIVSGLHVFTHCDRPLNKYHFLFWPLQLSAHSQMWSSLHWWINCRNADTISAALRPAIASCQRMQLSGLLGVFDVNVSLKVTRRLANRCSLVVSLGSTITLYISAEKQTTSSGMGFWYSVRAWVHLTLFFCVGYAFCTLIRVVIKIFDVVFVAETNFTLVLWRSWKTNIFRFKNITVCFITIFVVFFVFWKVFVHFLYWKCWIKMSLVWCILTFIVADCWIVWVYVQANDFCITLIRWQMTTPAIFNRCYCTVVTLTLSTLSFHLIWDDYQSPQKHRFTYNYIFAIF